MDNKDELEKYYPMFQSVSFLLGISISAYLFKIIVKKLGVDLEYGFNVYKLVKE